LKTETETEINCQGPEISENEKHQVRLTYAEN